jgi:hypothetical protein
VKAPLAPMNEAMAFNALDELKRICKKNMKRLDTATAQRNGK